MAIKKAKELVETDREHLQDQYLRTFAVASSFLDEKKMLEERVTKAEERAKVELDAIKGTYEKRTSVLEGDVSSWKKMAEFLTERVKGMEDQIGESAAEDAKLKRKLKKAKAELQRCQERNELLSSQVAEKEQELEDWKVKSREEEKNR